MLRVSELVAIGKQCVNITGNETNLFLLKPRNPYATDSLKVLVYFFPRFPSLRQLTLAYISYSSARVRYFLLDVARFLYSVDDDCLSSFIKLKITYILPSSLELRSHFFSKLQLNFTLSSLVFIHIIWLKLVEIIKVMKIKAWTSFRFIIQEKINIFFLI